uniref:Uncharacterized protein n=1 Tax=Physcomitrium patens TaxID=3218 RepID=A0A7I4BD49_PHYPA
MKFHVLEDIAAQDCTLEKDVVRGDKELFYLVFEAFKAIKKIADIEWDSQNPAQVMNMRDSLAEIKHNML